MKKTKKTREVLFVTENRHKVYEMQKILSRRGIKLKQRKTSVREPSSGTLEKTAVVKAKRAFAKVKKPLIIEDTGVYFSAYKNFPGVNAKRTFIKLGFAGLLAKITARKNRNAYFQTVIVYIWGKGRSDYKLFSGKLHGKLTAKVIARNKDVLPYEKIFIPRGYNKVLALISRKEKNKFSHRAIASEKFGKWFRAH